MKAQRNLIQNTISTSIAGLLALGLATSATSALAADADKENWIRTRQSGNTLPKALARRWAEKLPLRSKSARCIRVLDILLLGKFQKLRAHGFE